MCLAVPARVLEIEGGDALVRWARVAFGGVVRRISLAYVPEAAPGEYVLVHVGFALARIDEGEADRILRLLDDLSDATPAERPAPRRGPHASP